jgi:hypothetical protein
LDNAKGLGKIQSTVDRMAATDPRFPRISGLLLPHSIASLAERLDVLERGKEKQQPEGSQLNQRYEALESKTREYKRSMHMPAQVQPLTKPPRTEQPRSEDRVQQPKPLTDFYGEDRHELVQKLAYQHWEKRGSPLGSPEIDWFAAEKAMRAYLLSSGVELGPDEDLYS